MTKLEFLRRLEACLSQMPEGERSRQIEYYDEMIEDRIEDGMSEEEAVESLGDPVAVAEEILQDMSLPKLVGTRVRPKGGWSALSIVFLVLGFPLWFPLLIAFLAVGFAIYISAWAVMVSLFAAVFAIGVSGIALLIGMIITVPQTFIVGVATLGSALFCTGLSIVSFFGMLALGKVVIRVTAAAARGVKSWFIRKEVA